MKKIVVIYLVIISLPGYGQLCLGSLGDPIVNINFGYGSNPGNALAAAATSYVYVPSDCPSDGFYTVRNNTTQCFGNTWHSLPVDHTGNAGGYFMLVNASYQPGDFYVDTVKGLCANTTYEFASWILNLNPPNGCNGNPILPNLTFQVETVNGTIIQSYNTNDIATSASPQWKQYGSFFTSPAAVTAVVLRIRNNAPGGCGNDLALDDITFRPCGPLLIPSITGEPSTIADFCEGISRTYTLSSTVSAGFNNPAYQWQQFINGIWTDIAGANSISHIVNFPASSPVGTYQYRLSVAEGGNLGIQQCRIASSALIIKIKPRPLTSASNNGPLCTGRMLSLSATGGSNYSWTGPTGLTLIGNPYVINTASLADAGKYYVRVTNPDGCSKTDSSSVLIYPSPSAVPAFTDSSICTGTSLILLVNTAPGLAYRWFPTNSLTQADIFNPVAIPAGDTRYAVELTNGFLCKDTAYVNIKVQNKPIVDAGPARYLVAGQSVQLLGSISGNYASFSWFPVQAITNAQTLSPYVSPSMDMTYFLKAISSCGIVTDSVNVKRYMGIFIPNSFTPNGDGWNDTWNIPFLYAYPEFELRVFNRYGQLVYARSKNFEPWDGKYQGQLLSPGVYVYQVKLREAPFFFKGTVTLIR
ncbi:MAG: gliding motility-associated C-terminal domain-containing protein [Ferruginibacter sp.]